ncbi:aldo/keto reductase [Streptomyces sp. Wb2n-11]|uniref:aldo/keto reductase n=1 Tax=Streptomyces sp. Wb2n-11 TaxID=1030533 RepID=UPI000A77C58C|nr:aldo/keto reductase [Streptomyces sp. Wb2n-11]
MLPHDLPRRPVAPGLLLNPLCVGTGTSRWSASTNRPDDEKLLDGLRCAVESGVELVDTADSHLYGHAERLVGKVLKENRGHRVQVSSTVGRVLGSAPHPYAGPRVRHQLEQTLENLYLAELAVYTLESYDFGNGDRYLAPVVEQMRTLRDLGQIRAIGLRGPDGCSSPRYVRRFLQLFDEIRPDVVWTRASGLLPLPDVGGGENLDTFTDRHGVGLMIASPLANGILAGRRLRMGAGTADQTEKQTVAIDRGLTVLANRFGSADALLRVALRSILQQAQNAVVAVGVGDRAEVSRYFGCLGGPLCATDLAVIEEVFQLIRNAVRLPHARTMIVEAADLGGREAVPAQPGTPLRR